MSLRPVVELAAAALGEKDKQFNDHDVDAISILLEEEGVEELCDLCLAYSDSEGRACMGAG